MKRTLVAAMVAALSFGAGSASAATAHMFNFASPPPVSNQPSQNFTADTGLVVGVTGKTYTISGGNFVGVAGIDVENNSYGLISNNGSSGPSDYRETHKHAIDSKYDDEAMIFDFGKQVTLTGLHFGWAYSSKNNFSSSISGAMFNLFVDGVLKGAFATGSVLPGGLTGSVFAIGATAFSKYGYTYESHFKLKKMTVEYDPPSNVPLPAAGWMLIAGLGGIAAMKRRKAA